MKYEKPACEVLELKAQAPILDNSPEKVNPGDGSDGTIKKDEGDDGGWAATRRKRLWS